MLIKAEQKDTYKLANQIIQRVKEFILVLHDISKSPDISEDLKQTILGANKYINQGYMQELNAEISTYLELPTDNLVQLIVDEKYDEYRNLALSESFNNNDMETYASYCFNSGYDLRRFDWWAPSDDLQEKKYKAIERIIDAAKNYSKENARSRKSKQ